MMLHPRVRTLVLTLLVFSATVAHSSAAEKFRFPEGKHGKGELRYVGSLPVLTVAGTPEEIGEQVGILALKPSWEVVKKFREYLKATDSEKTYPLVVAAAKAMYAQFPEQYRRECDAMCKAAGVDRDLIILANTFLDLKQLDHPDDGLRAGRAQAAPVDRRRPDLRPAADDAGLGAAVAFAIESGPQYNRTCGTEETTCLGRYAT